VARLIAFALPLALLAACAGPPTREELLVVAERNAKLYAKDVLKLNTNDPFFTLKAHPDNLEWSRYWASASVHGDPEVKGWNDKIHTLFAFYAMEPGDTLTGRENVSVWIFTDREEGEVKGVLRQQRGYAKDFGGGSK
jgi:hypothetical protein